MKEDVLEAAAAEVVGSHVTEASEASSSDEGLTTAEEMLQAFRKKVISLSTGKSIEVTNFMPAYIPFLDDPLVQAFVNRDAEGVLKEAFPGHPDELAGIQRMLRTMVAESISSLRVSTTRQSDCPEGVVSIDLFTPKEFFELFRAQYEVSEIDAENAMFRESAEEPADA